VSTLRGVLFTFLGKIIKLLAFLLHLRRKLDMKNLGTILGAASIAVGLSTLPVSAAPQVLAVMASLGSQQMSCGSSICTTSLSSYCLQRERDVPTTGQAYLPAAKDQFALVVIDKNGTETSLPASDHMTFRSSRGYSAVNVVISKKTLAKLGGVSAKIIVSDGAALIPEPKEGDPNPISEQEIAYATGSLRDHGNEIVDALPDAEAAGVINRMAATIIPKAPANAESLEQLWHDVIQGLGQSHPANSEGIRKARETYDWCQGRTSYHSMGGIKSCLEYKHDSTIMRLNTDYWESQPGY